MMSWLLEKGGIIRSETRLKELIQLFQQDPKFLKDGRRATPDELRRFILHWFTDRGIPLPDKSALYAERLLDIVAPKPGTWSAEELETTDIVDTVIPNEHVYDVLLTLSPRYRVNGFKRLIKILTPATPESLVIRFIKEIPIIPGVKFFIGKPPSQMNARSFTQGELMVLGSRPDVFVTKQWVRNVDITRQGLDAIYRGRFGDNYTERYAPSPGVNISQGISSQLPSYIQELLNEGGSVLSGGSLLRIVTGGFSNSPLDPDSLPVGLRTIFSSMSDSSTMSQDYDIYTVRSPTEIYNFFSRHGFKWIREIIGFDPEYTSWLMTLTRRGESVDIIFTNRYDNLNHRPPERPQDFIVKEFDIDVTKIWYDGENVWAPNEKIARGVMERKLELDFHPNMTINVHKTNTTMKRLFKYYQRGFSIDIRDGPMFERFMNAFAEQSIDRGFMNLYPFSLEFEREHRVVEELTNRYIMNLSSNRETFFEYNDYYIRSRNAQYFGLEFSYEKGKRMPISFKRVRRLLQRIPFYSTINIEEINNLFFKYLGIGLYQVAGGKFITNTVALQAYQQYLTYFEPFALKKLNIISSDENERIRQYPVPSDNLPECSLLFASRPQSTEAFKEELIKFADLCNALDSDPPCHVYLKAMKPYIIHLFTGSFLGGASQRLSTLVTTRGEEIFTAFENMAEHVAVRHSRIYVRYLNEPGIDAGGLRKEFYVNVCRQLRPLFSYLNPGSTDPRLYISNAPDQEILSQLNSGNPPQAFVVDDLPPLYYMAGKMIADALINGYSTELPLSRALLASMVSGDTGVNVSYLKTAYIMEQNTKNVLEQLYLYNMDDPEDSEEVLKIVALETYLVDAGNPKFVYVRNFINGFSPMARVLALFKIAPRELYSSVCSSNVTREIFEQYIRSSSTSFIYNHMDNGYADEISPLAESPRAGLKDKLLGFFFDNPDNLVSLLHNFFEERFPRSLSRNDTLIRYYQLVVEGITNLNVLDINKVITFRFVDYKVPNPLATQISIHNCFDEAEISASWFTNTNLEDWVLISTGAFMEKKYTSA